MTTPDDTRARDEHPPTSEHCEHGHRWASPTPCPLCEQEHDEAMRHLERQHGVSDDR